MDPSVRGIPDDVTVAQALERVHRHPAGALYYLYIVDAEGSLTGVANLREIMSASPDRALATLVTRSPWSLAVGAGVAAITAHPAWDRVHALPVVDGRRFVGVLRYKVMRRLERGLAVRTPDEQAATTRAALAELFGLSLAGLTGWAAAAARGSTEAEGSQR
jgi:predicted transcriptional regulator